MKSYLYRILPIFILLLVLSSCTSNRSVGVFDFSDAKHIGYSFEKYCERTKLSPDTFTCIGEDDHLYLADTVTFNGVEFQKYLLFGIDNALFGIGYGCRIPHMEPDELESLITDIYKLIVDKHGEPTTYPGLPNRISTLEDYSAVQGGTDEWNFTDDDPMCDLRFVFRHAYDDLMDIYLEYRVANLRDGQRIYQDYIKE